jgi:hypothetical protein
MTAPLLLFTAGIYGWVALGYWGMSRPGMALAFVAYALANLGFAVDAWRQ